MNKIILIILSLILIAIIYFNYGPPNSIVIKIFDNFGKCEKECQNLDGMDKITIINKKAHCVCVDGTTFKLKMEAL